MGSGPCTNMLVSHAHISVHGCKWQMYSTLSLWVLWDETPEPIWQWTVFTLRTCIVLWVQFPHAKRLSVCMHRQSCRDVNEVCYSVHWTKWSLFVAVRHSHIHGSSVSVSTMLNIECKCRLWLSWRQLLHCQGIVPWWNCNSASCSRSSNWVTHCLPFPCAYTSA